MKIATLVELYEDELNGDIQTFDISTPEGMNKAHSEFSDRCLWELSKVEIFENGDFRKLTPDEIQERISEAIDRVYKLDCHGIYIALYWSELIVP